MSNRITHNNVLARRFGVMEDGMVDLPVKISNVRISRILAEHRGECGYCFPHGFENSNSRWKKDIRSWKRYRKTQYRVKKMNG